MFEIIEEQHTELEAIAAEEGTTTTTSTTSLDIDDVDFE